MIARELAARLPWVTMTPFGLDVLPEVNCKNARSPSPTGTPGPVDASGAATGFAPNVPVRQRALAAVGADEGHPLVGDRGVVAERVDERTHTSFGPGVTPRDPARAASSRIAGVGGLLDDRLAPIETFLASICRFHHLRTERRSRYGHDTPGDCDPLPRRQLRVPDRRRQRRARVRRSVLGGAGRDGARE